MKKILYAWIEQVIQFDSVEERSDFISRTRGVKVVKFFEEDGKYNLHVKRPYNNNRMM